SRQGFVIKEIDKADKTITAENPGVITGWRIDKDGNVVVDTTTGSFTLKAGGVEGVVDAQGNRVILAGKGALIGYKHLGFVAHGEAGKETKFDFQENRVVMTGPGTISSQQINGVVQNGGRLAINLGATVNDFSLEAEKAKLTVYKDKDKDTYSGNFKATYAGARVTEYTLSGRGSWSEIAGFVDANGNQIRDILWRKEGEYTVKVMDVLGGSGLVAQGLLTMKEARLNELNGVKALRDKIKGMTPEQAREEIAKFLKGYNGNRQARATKLDDDIKKIDSELAKPLTQGEKNNLRRQKQAFQAERQRIDKDFITVDQVDAYLKDSITSFNNELKVFSERNPNLGFKSRFGGIVINRGLVETRSSEFSITGGMDSSYTTYRAPPEDIQYGGKKLTRKGVADALSEVEEKLKADPGNQQLINQRTALRQQESLFKGVSYCDSHEDGEICKGSFTYRKEGFPTDSSFDYKVKKEDGKSRLEVSVNGMLNRGQGRLERAPSVRLAIDGTVPGLNYLDVNRDSIMAAEQLYDNTVGKAAEVLGEKIADRVEQFQQARAKIGYTLDLAKYGLGLQRKELIDRLNGLTKNVNEEAKRLSSDKQYMRGLFKGLDPDCQKDKACYGRELGRLIDKAAKEKYLGTYIKDLGLDVTQNLRTLAGQILDREFKPVAEKLAEFAVPAEVYEVIGEGLRTQQIVDIARQRYEGASENVKQAFDKMLEAGTERALGNDLKAIQLYEEAGKVGDARQIRDSIDAIGQVYEGQQDYVKAQEQYDKILKTDAGDYQARMSLARVLARQDKTDEARTQNNLALQSLEAQKGTLNQKYYESVKKNIYQSIAGTYQQEAGKLPPTAFDKREAKYQEARKVLADAKLSTTQIDNIIRVNELRGELKELKDEPVKNFDNYKKQTEKLNEIAALTGEHSDYQDLGSVYAKIGNVEAAIDATEIAQLIATGKLEQAGFDAQVVGGQYNLDQFFSDTNLRLAQLNFDKKDFAASRDAASFNLALDETDLNAQRYLSRSLLKLDVDGSDAIKSWQDYIADNEERDRLQAEGNIGLATTRLSLNQHAEVKSMYNNRANLFGNVLGDYADDITTVYTVSLNRQGVEALEQAAKETNAENKAELQSKALGLSIESLKARKENNELANSIINQIIGQQVKDKQFNKAEKTLLQIQEGLGELSNDHRLLLARSYRLQGKDVEADQAYGELKSDLEKITDKDNLQKYQLAQAKEGLKEDATDLWEQLAEIDVKTASPQEKRIQQIANSALVSIEFQRALNTITAESKQLFDLSIEEMSDAEAIELAKQFGEPKNAAEARTLLKVQGEKRLQQRTVSEEIIKGTLAEDLLVSQTRFQSISDEIDKREGQITVFRKNAEEWAKKASELRAGISSAMLEDAKRLPDEDKPQIVKNYEIAQALADEYKQKQEEAERRLRELRAQYEPAKQQLDGKRTAYIAGFAALSRDEAQEAVDRYTARLKILQDAVGEATQKLNDLKSKGASQTEISAAERELEIANSNLDAGRETLTVLEGVNLVKNPEQIADLKRRLDSLRSERTRADTSPELERVDREIEELKNAHGSTSWYQIFKRSVVYNRLQAKEAERLRLIQEVSGPEKELEELKKLRNSLLWFEVYDKRTLDAKIKEKEEEVRRFLQVEEEAASRSEVALKALSLAPEIFTDLTRTEITDMRTGLLGLRSQQSYAASGLAGIRAATTSELANRYFGNGELYNKYLEQRKKDEAQFEQAGRRLWEARRNILIEDALLKTTTIEEKREALRQMEAELGAEELSPKEFIIDRNAIRLAGFEYLTEEEKQQTLNNLKMSAQRSQADRSYFQTVESVFPVAESWFNEERRRQFNQMFSAFRTSEGDSKELVNARLAQANDEIDKAVNKELKDSK
ncbi:hypothetical protein KY328_05530, partial [Candidatus Woesearchaeota archaeon]|nr:hypothetical protein [Candidatus Woesearchaeota archaeon]